MATVGKHSCGWGVLRLRVNWVDSPDRVSQRRRSCGSRNRILMESVLALFHGIVPPLGTGTESCYFRRVVRFSLSDLEPREQTGVIRCLQWNCSRSKRP